MKSLVVTALVIVLGTVGVLSFLTGWIGAGLGEQFAEMWLLFGLGAIALVGAALLARSPHSRITLTRRFRR